MAVSKRVKEQSELMEIRLQKLKEAMVKEKEERRKFMETRWKSTQFLKNSIPQPPKRDNMKLSMSKAGGNKQEDKTKKPKDRKEEKLKNNKLNPNKSVELQAQNVDLSSGIKCAGSLLHSRTAPSTFKPEPYPTTVPSTFKLDPYLASVPSTFKQESYLTVPSTFKLDPYLATGPSTFKLDPYPTESIRKPTDRNEPVTLISSAGAQPIHFDGVYDEEKNMEDFEKAVTAWRENKSQSVDDKSKRKSVCWPKNGNGNDPTSININQSQRAIKKIEDCFDKETNPLVPYTGKFDFSCLIESYESALSERKESNESIVWSEHHRLTESILSDDDNPSVELNSDDFDDFKENIEYESVDFENSRLVAAATGSRKESSSKESNNEPIANSAPTSLIQVTELETMPFESVVEGQRWILPGAGESVEYKTMVGKCDDLWRPSFTAKPIFENNLLLFNQSESRKLKSRIKLDLLSPRFPRRKNRLPKESVSPSNNSQYEASVSQVQLEQNQDGVDVAQHEVISSGTSLSLDIQTPVPSSDGCPKECLQNSESDFVEDAQNIKQNEMKIDKETVAIVESEQTAAEPLAVDLLIDIAELEEQINTINEDEEEDNGDRFDDKAAVASLK